jgi:hypothetical protein
MSSSLQSNPRIADKVVGGAKRPPRIHIGQWLGVLPFFIFSALILIGPTLILAFRSLEGLGGGLTLSNYRELVTPTVIDAYSMSIKVSLTTAILGGIFGFLIAWAISIGSLPGPFRDATITFHPQLGGVGMRRVGADRLHVHTGEAACGRHVDRQIRVTGKRYIVGNRIV